MNKIFDLHGKTAIITGASSGLGVQFARCLSSAGARVILAARSLDKLEALSNEIDNTRAIKMDIANKKSVQECFAELEKLGEKINICINNAGIFKDTPIFSEDPDCDFESVMQTNVMGTWYVTKAVANHMKNNNIHGSIINIGSVNGDSYLKPERSGYAISKAAIMHMTKALVRELSPNIRINCISPGPFHTPATRYKISNPELKTNLEASIPLGFFAEPQDLDGIILYLASNEASRYVTGSTFTIDGGVSCV